MVDTNILVCPVCNSQLNLAEINCPSCKYQFRMNDGFYDFTPIPPPELIKPLWNTWEELQKNGEKAYNEWAEASLSIGLTDVEKAFGKFADLNGNVLDVGCGPQNYPGYATADSSKINLFGVDPLKGVKERNFNFIIGLGEYLPFKSDFFDRVIYGTSLDHLFNPVQSLKEAYRILKKDGAVAIWHGLPPAPQKRSKFRIFLSNVKYELINRIRPTFSYKFYKSLKVPKGAIDHFHFSHPSIEQVSSYLAEAGFKNVRTERFQDSRSYFLFATPNK